MSAERAGRVAFAVVGAGRRSLRMLALPGRPFFVANHAWMTRSGRRGLLALLRQRV